MKIFKSNLNTYLHRSVMSVLSTLATALLLLMSASEAYAEPITREQARQRAVEFLSTRKGSRQLKAVESDVRLSPRRHVRKIKGLTTDALDLYYVFDRGTDEGFVIVSGDDQTVPVLGYTDTGHFDYSQLPPNMVEWLTAHEEELDAIRRSNTPIRRANIDTHDAIEQLCTTKWNQGSPYNQSCPMFFSKGRSVTGCVATAMAQILYYHRAKMVTETQAEMPSYTNGKELDGQKFTVPGVPAGSVIDWDNMLETYGSSATAKQKKAVADLMSYCGVSVGMSYSNSGSGAQSSKVADALPKYFGFGESVKYYWNKNNDDGTTRYTEKQWDEMIYNELANSRPVYLSGHNANGGHAFVADGYDGNLCYHINWGWGGSSDGYYLLASLKPGSQGIGGSDGGYSQSRQCVVGIEPINFETRAMPFENATIKRLCTEAFDKDGDGKLTYGEAAEVTDLGDTFKGKAITTFNELYNFTGLTVISDDAFKGCSRLTTVKLPKTVKAIGAHAFEGCKVLTAIHLTDDIQSIGEGAFNGCTKLPNLTLPAGLTAIEASCFEGCVAFTEVTLPLSIRSIGSRAFAKCTRLKSFNVKTINPEQIALGADVWAEVNLANATLNTLQGNRQYFSSADQWRDFCNLREQRTLAGGNFTTFDTEQLFFIYNVGTGRYLTRGEACGTQAMVAETDAPMAFRLRHTATMPDGVFGLYSDDTGNAKHFMFRTTTDKTVGKGIHACFVDGDNSRISDKSAYWKISLVEGTENTYTLQTPSGVSGYVESQYLGIQPSHASNAAIPTFGAYSDIEYADYALNCQWLFTPCDREAQALFQAASQLENLLTIAKKQKLDVTNEEGVYTNYDSSESEIQNACARLRKRLGFIAFKDDAVRRVCVESIDADSDGEISYDEAAAITTLEGIFQNNVNIADATDLKYFTRLKQIDANEFSGCTKLQAVVLPDNVTAIYSQAFKGCKTLESVDMPMVVKEIGADAFNGCTNLKEVRVAVADPALIALGSNVFKSVPVSSAVLYVPYGSEELYAQADVWKEFGQIRPMRTMVWPDFAEFEADKDFYIFNLGQRAYINKGEAYGTQAVVATTGLVYQLHRTSAMPADTYYMQSLELGTNSDKNVLFRTSSDSKVGKGIKACFVDHAIKTDAYWTVKPVADRIYTIQVPSNQEDYVEGEFFGTDRNHETEYTSSQTNGVYWDVAYDTNPAAAQWAFVSVAEVKANREFFDLTEDLRQLLERAGRKDIDVADEQAVYDNFGASQEQIQAAIASVRTKLHYTTFIDSKVKELALSRWDLDDDDELSAEELAAVTDLSTVFKGASAIMTLEDLRYFTSITAVPADAFRANSGMLSVIIPAGVATIGEKAFSTTSKLKHIAILNPTTVVDGSTSGISTSAKTIFVPAALVEAYNADAFWGQFTIEEYTGVPTVTAEPATRQYGRSNPEFTYVITGAPVTGEPSLSTEAVLTSPVGEYAIHPDEGTIISLGVQFVDGTLTVERAPVTVTALSYTREYGEENPTFEAKYSILRNHEKIEDVLTHEPVFECDATAESYAGVYEIRVSGCEADNYEFTYVAGKLTVQGGPDGIDGVKDDGEKSSVYDLAGRKVTAPQRGIYVRGGKKVLVDNKR